MNSKRNHDILGKGGDSSIIKVIGVGGGGGNAVTHMYRHGIRGVEFYICNTDVQALEMSQVPNKVQIGLNLTQGLGAGANPEKGRNAALENKEDIRDFLSNNTKMLFITAGMGGGTGTGAAPVIAEVAKELGILTVGIVTAPFGFEGKPKRVRAQEGVETLRRHCDCVIVILNDRLRDIYGKASMKEAFRQADNVLLKAAKSIAEIITVPGNINVDFEDVRTVMKDAGAAVMGSATAEGENRAKRAAEGAISSPLLNNTSIYGAKYILLCIVVGDEESFQMDELEEITDYVQEQAGDEAEIIFGQAVDESLGDAIIVTIIATGFQQSSEIPAEYQDRRVYDLMTNKRIKNRIPTRETNIYDENDFFDKPVEEKPPVPKYQQPETPPTYHNKPDKIVFSLEDDDYFLSEEEKKKKEALDSQAVANVSVTPSTSSQRISTNQLKGISDLTHDELQEKKDVPAYLRRNIKLTNMPHSSENSSSRYNVDDDDLIGGNRFLHDNID